MTEAYNIAKDVLAIIGLLWIALSVFFGVSDTIKGRQMEREGMLP